MATSWLLLGQAAEELPLSTTGAIIMVCSVGAVLCLISFCLYKVLTLPPVDAEHEEFDPPRSLSM